MTEDRRRQTRQTYQPVLPDEPQSPVLPRFYWLETPVTVSTTITTYAYAWFDASRWVPKGATALLLSAECEKSGGALSVLSARPSPRLTAVKVFNATASDTHSVPLLVLPLDQRYDRPAFQHTVTGSSFGTSISLTLVGYLL